MAEEKETTLEEAFAELDGMLEKLADRDVPLELSLIHIWSHHPVSVCIVKNFYC